ncbi:unnamed protein product [Urochloa humidicola]
MALPPRAPHSSPSPPSLASAPVAAPDTRTPADPPPPLRSPIVATVARREAISEEEEKENPDQAGRGHVISSSSRA